MSILFGIFYKSGKPVSDELETMYAGMKHCPHETHELAVRGRCGFGHMLTYNTPEAVHEHMPQWIEDARLLFVAEGRIDNREALFSALQVPPAQQREMPDGDLMLRAYLQWGEACVDHLEGKWSLAAFHEQENRLFLARDKWDYTNLMYYSDNDVFAFASYQKGLLPLPFVSRKFDDFVLARFLIVWADDFNQSIFQNTFYLLPSYCLLVTPASEQLRHYWNYADIRVRQGLKLEEYVDDLYDNLNKAVAVRLRSYRPIASTLSGGMDSSTVSIIAAEHLAKQGKRLRTYTHIPAYAPSESLPEHNFGNERPFVEAIVQASGTIDPVYLDSVEISPLAGIRKAIQLCNRPFHGAINTNWFLDICQTAQAEGYGTLLTGEFGNATISWPGIESALPAAVLLRRSGFLRLVKHKLVIPMLHGKTPVARLYKHAVYGSRPWGHYSYCTREFEKSVRLVQRMRKSDFDPTFKLYFANPKDKARRIFDVNIQRLPFSAEFGYEFGLEFRDPTGDPRVIACALSIPNEMYCGEMNKWVLRAMMKGRMPDMVRLNVKKGKQSADASARLYAYRGEMDCVVSEMENSAFSRIVDTARIRAEWEALKADPKHYPQSNATHLLRHISAFELYRQGP